MKNATKILYCDFGRDCTNVIYVNKYKDGIVKILNYFSLCGSTKEISENILNLDATFQFDYIAIDKNGNGCALYDFLSDKENVVDISFNSIVVSYCLNSIKTDIDKNRICVDENCLDFNFIYKQKDSLIYVDEKRKMLKINCKLDKNKYNMFICLVGVYSAWYLDIKDKKKKAKYLVLVKDKNTLVEKIKEKYNNIFSYENRQGLLIIHNNKISLEFKEILNSTIDEIRSKRADCVILDSKINIDEKHIEECLYPITLQNEKASKVKGVVKTYNINDFVLDIINIELNK